MLEPTRPSLEQHSPPKPGNVYKIQVYQSWLFKIQETLVFERLQIHCINTIASLLDDALDWLDDRESPAPLND